MSQTVQIKGSALVWIPTYEPTYELETRIGNVTMTVKPHKGNWMYIIMRGAVELSRGFGMKAKWCLQNAEHQLAQH